jgi:hypothetical protein
MTMTSKPLVMALIASILSQAGPKATPTPLVKTQPPGMSLTISVDKNVINAGSDLWLTVVLKNTLSHKIFINTEKGHPTFDYTIDVSDEKGLPIADTKLGHMRKRDISVDPDTGKPIVWVTSKGPQIFVDPGNTLTDKIELTKLFNVEQPGRYLIRVSRPDTSSAVNDMEVKSWPIAESNVISVTVSQ